MALERIAPELDDSAKVELADYFVRFDKCVHVGLETVLRIHRLLVELNLNEAIGVRPDYEVYLGPVDHYHLLHVVDDVREFLGRQTLNAPVLLSRSKIAMQDLLVGEPFCS